MSCVVEQRGETLPPCGWSIRLTLTALRGQCLAHFFLIFTFTHYNNSFSFQHVGLPPVAMWYVRDPSTLGLADTREGENEALLFRLKDEDFCSITSGQKHQTC